MTRLKPTQWAALGACSVLLLLPAVFRLDGRPHANWEQFLGRFHPAWVHLPIGFLVLVPLFEIAARFRPSLRETPPILLLLTLAAALTAVVLGYLLAYGSGTAGALVTGHMWGGIGLTVGVLLCLFARPGWTGNLQHPYPILLAAVVFLTGWTGHQGGALTYGKGYLTEFAPHALRSPGPAASQAGAFYPAHIQPIFDANCLSCHSEAKVKGGLRLDTYDRLMRGGSEGAAVVAGKPDKSLLVKRITLPMDDKHFMPSEGKPALKPEEIAWIKAWIQDGASETAVTVAGVVLPVTPKETPLRPVGDYTKLAPQIADLERTQNIRLTPVSRKPSDGLVLNTVDAGTKYTDAQLAQLDKLAPYLVEAELGRTSLTDASLETLAKFTHLRALHLEGTAITGKDLAKLSKLPDLTYLNLSGTHVTQANAAPLGSMKNLQHVYLYNTPAEPAAPAVQ